MVTLGRHGHDSIRVVLEGQVVRVELVDFLEARTAWTCDVYSDIRVELLHRVIQTI